MIADNRDNPVAPSLGQRLFRRLAQRWFRLTRALTLGVRALVLDDDGRVLLIRATYWPGWQLPGGGVERGETVLEALRRELMEEAGIELSGAPELFAVYSSAPVFPNDHVLLYVVRPGGYERKAWRPTREIAAAEFFAPDALPEDVQPGARRRIAEVLDGVAVDATWRE
ncbi:MAG TPA: NUDIX domain-containing protein [Thermopetrobacter sp.]|nr:NUDIX domain-containing protein [Thermopetrobacter sp.]